MDLIKSPPRRQRVCDAVLVVSVYARQVVIISKLIFMYFVVFVLRALWSLLYWLGVNIAQVTTCRIARLPEPAQREMNDMQQWSNPNPYYSTLLAFFFVFEVVPTAVVLLGFKKMLAKGPGLAESGARPQSGCRADFAQTAGSTRRSTQRCCPEPTQRGCSVMWIKCETECNAALLDTAPLAGGVHHAGHVPLVVRHHVAAVEDAQHADLGPVLQVCAGMSAGAWWPVAHW